ncbi:MAG: (2Fe-2S)-binding protein [Gemmatimonadota bacterium]|nr:(2Fe-2S)-binding protein [Gemmatimonadota bacterium]
MKLSVNGTPRDVDPSRSPTLLAALRDQLELTGAKLGCDHGECGACTVRLNGDLVYACLTLTAACDGAAVQTVEGLADGGTLHPLQQAFITHDAAQCGYCTPGQLLAAAALLDQRPHPTDDEIRTAMSGNLCRCGTYPKIVTAIRSVADASGASATRADAPPSATGDAP